MAAVVKFVNLALVVGNVEVEVEVEVLLVDEYRVERELDTLVGRLAEVLVLIRVS